MSPDAYINTVIGSHVIQDSDSNLDVSASDVEHIKNIYDGNKSKLGLT